MRLTQRLLSKLFIVLLLGVAACKGHSHHSTAHNNAAACVPGELDCTCHPNGTCDLANGEPLSCVGNQCRKLKSPELGQLGGACSAGACETFKGQALTCVAGQCELADCPSGNLGCPCGAYGACRTYAGKQALCSSQWMCALNNCQAGSAGCACKSNASCDAGAACVSGICLVKSTQVTIQIADAEARSCDILLREKNAPVFTLSHDPEVAAQFFRRHGKIGVAMSALSDTPLSASMLVLQSQNESFAQDALEIEYVDCRDSSNHTRLNPGVTLE